MGGSSDVGRFLGVKGSPILGSVIIGLLLLSLAYTAASVYTAMGVERKPEAFREYALTKPRLVGEVVHVQFDMTVKRGGVNMSFVEDAGLLYKIIVKGNNIPEPSISYTQMDGVLAVKVFAEEGEFEVILGSGQVYSLAVEVGVGGVSVRLTEDSTVDSLKLHVAYLGGTSLEALEGASFNRLELRANTGGIRLKVERPNLQENALVSARVEVGGIQLESFTLTPPAGGRLTALVDTGGIALNSRGFQVVKSTALESEIRTPGYEEAPTRLDVDLQVGVGGIAINQPYSLGFP
ncbi:hypothetical protein [Candidatus Hecatella orcuttiae]|uniref:hypothetical protein n=1 Tax=Candidatus Hecatella orcuttiae TaxID=1935119 RepID=UPI002868172F|nr:hypothetical protein [Candidatus Hecatella orcuttiae]